MRAVECARAEGERCMRSVRFAVPSTPPPSRLTPKTQRRKPIFDPIRAPTVLGGTAPYAQLSSAARVRFRFCACARATLRAALLFLCALCRWPSFVSRGCLYVHVRARLRVCMSFCVFMSLRVRACVRACMRACLRACVRACVRPRFGSRVEGRGLSG
jgi:hypothetical protein